MFFPYQCIFEKVTIVYSFTLCCFLISRHHIWELFKSYNWTIFSAGPNFLISSFFKVTIVQCQNAQNKVRFFIAHLFNIFRAYNNCAVFAKTVWHFSGWDNDTKDLLIQEAVDLFFTFTFFLFFYYFTLFLCALMRPWVFVVLIAWSNMHTYTMSGPLVSKNKLSNLFSYYFQNQS